MRLIDAHAQLRFARLAASADAGDDDAAVVRNRDRNQFLALIEQHEGDALAARSDEADFAQREGQQAPGGREAGELCARFNCTHGKRDRGQKPFAFAHLHEVASGLEARRNVGKPEEHALAAGSGEKHRHVRRPCNPPCAFKAPRKVDKGRQGRAVASTARELRNGERIDAPVCVKEGELIRRTAFNCPVELVAHLEAHERAVVPVPCARPQEPLL